jgi:hypothetical protein
MSKFDKKDLRTYSLIGRMNWLFEEMAKVQEQVAELVQEAEPEFAKGMFNQAEHFRASARDTMMLGTQIEQQLMELIEEIGDDAVV